MTDALESSEPLQPTPPNARHRVRIWFGQHAIADYTAEPRLARRYASAMRRRFPGLQVSIDAIEIAPPVGCAPLPDEQWWAMVPR